MADQFSGGAKRFSVKRPTELCNPVSVDGEVIKDRTAHLMCYKLNLWPRGQAAIPVLTGVYVNNRFGPEQLNTARQLDLCVPSETFE